MTPIEEDLKRVFKGLLTEKNEAKEGLQQKFQEKLKTLHEPGPLSVEKVKLAIKKLSGDLQESQTALEALRISSSEEIALLQNHNAILKEQLQQSEETILSLQKIEETNRSLENAVTLLKEEKKRAAEELIELRVVLQSAQKQALENKTKEHPFENERQKLVERLAETLSQMHEQNDIMRDMREENERLQQEKNLQSQASQQLEKQFFDLKEQIDRHADIEQKFFAEKKENAHWISLVKKQDEELTTLRKKLEEPLQEERFSKEKEDQLLARSYEKMREISHRHLALIDEHAACERQVKEKQERIESVEAELQTIYAALKNAQLQGDERDAEMRKAQQHIAKKVKETTIMHDLIERQKGELRELQIVLKEQTHQIDHLQQELHTFKLQEVHFRALTDEKIRASNQAISEWEEKTKTLQKDLIDKEEQLKAFQKMQDAYHQFSANLKTLVDQLPKNV